MIFTSVGEPIKQNFAKIPCTVNLGNGVGVEETMFKIDKKCQQMLWEPSIVFGFMST